ncbi:hypothetical protein Dimus_030491 [Dionaea muscipula]
MKELAKKLMADHVEEMKSLASYGTPSTSGTRPPIIHPQVAATSFETKPTYRIRVANSYVIVLSWDATIANKEFDEVSIVYKHPNDEDTCVLDEPNNQSHCDYLDSVASLEALEEEALWETSSDEPPAVPGVTLRQLSSPPASMETHPMMLDNFVSFYDPEEVDFIKSFGPQFEPLETRGPQPESSIQNPPRTQNPFTQSEITQFG